MEKGIRADHELDALALACDVERVHRPYRRRCLAFCCAEGRKVVLAEERARSDAHRVDLERRVIPPGVARGERRTHRTVDEPIAVGAGHSAEARVELAVNRP